MNRTLKLAGKTTLTFPKRKRFNENTDEIIKEMNSSASNARITSDKMQAFDTRSQMSKKSMTKSELSKFFAQGKKKAEEAVSERLSQMSRASKFKNNLATKAKDDEMEQPEQQQ